MSAITKKSEGSIPLAGNAGTPANDQVSQSEQIKVCPHTYAGCISQNSGMCTHDGPCEPIDSRGRWFAVNYTYENGQTFMHREYRQSPVTVRGTKAICGGNCMCQPSDHDGRGACGKSMRDMKNAYIEAQS